MDVAGVLLYHGGRSRGGSGDRLQGENATELELMSFGPD